VEGSGGGGLGEGRGGATAPPAPSRWCVRRGRTRTHMVGVPGGSQLLRASGVGGSPRASPWWPAA
jgi:hypothetical protein